MLPIIVHRNLEMTEKMMLLSRVMLPHKMEYLPWERFVRLSFLNFFYLFFILVLQASNSARGIKLNSIRLQ